MKTVLFDGKKAALKRQTLVAQQAQALSKPITLASLFFEEDQGSLLYTRLKGQAAKDVGMIFTDYRFSIASTRVASVQEQIKQLNRNPDINGILIQKPTQAVWKSVYRGKLTFRHWWQALTTALSVEKDIDCLTAENLRRLQTGHATILPATVKAVMSIIDEAISKPVSDQIVSVVGCSDIVGSPLADVLENAGCTVTRHCGQIDMSALPKADIVISATGRPNIITGGMIKSGSIVIDLGSPQGDVDSKGVIGRAAFITPVPGGVGPMTVVSLLENTVELAQRHVTV